MKNLFFSIIVLSGICINVNAQEKFNKESNADKYSANESFSEKKSSKELKGDKYSFNYSYSKAINSYSHSKQLSVEGQRRLAKSYSKMDQNTLSEEAYAKLISTPGGNLPEDFYNYAMILKINGKFTESNKQMDKFAELKPEDLRAKSYESSKDKLAYLLKDNGKFKIVHLDANTKAADFGACYYKNNIVFASNRSTGKLFHRKDNWSRKPFLDMYYSEINGDQLKTPKKFNKRMNGKMNEGPASFSNDGNNMAFTKNNYDLKRKDRVVNLEIFFSKQTEDKWSKPVPFILNNKDYSVGHPCLTSDGKTMYFTSDMPGGYGGADIYRITKDPNGDWGKAENLGDKINTEGNEMFPFYEEKSGNLAFSSDGLFGLGGLDIFICVKNGTGFSSPNNAGTPVNTQYDDFALIANDNMAKGYFSSNRNGGSGDDDIYSINLSKDTTAEEIAAVNPQVEFSVYAPKNISIKRRVRETFPIRNYVFFNLGSTEIPDRYVLLKKDQVKDFKEDQLEVFSPKNLSGRSGRQMTAYYNVLNILGDRMGKHPKTVVRLAGSSMQGIPDGLAMAESVKKYLVNVFEIDPSRIKTEGRIKPRIQNEYPGFTKEVDLLREGDHRVSIWSESPELMMEFQSGPDAPLKPVEIMTTQEAPIDSYVSFNCKGGKEAYTSWSLELMDEKGNVQNFGPYTQDKISIPGKTILGTLPEADYKVTMIGTTKSGNTEKKETSMHMVLWTASQREEGMRFSIIYEFNDSKAINIYEKYLTNIVIPKIPKGGKVIICGYTDVIGTEEHNLDLSNARANDVRKIFEKGLANAGRKDVNFEVYGFGEDLNFSPFENSLPEERFYNRTVIIDIIPKG